MATPKASTPAKAVCYFRTLDRWPGGNADMLTVKVTVKLSPDAGPGVEAQFYSCFDGRHAWFPPRRVAIDPGDALAEFLDATRSLAARGESVLAVTPFDPVEDEWDCDWSDSEIFLYATDDAPETPEAALLRLVRRTAKVEATTPDPELEHAFALARRLTGVGRVFEFSNTKDALSAAYRAPGGPAAQDLDYTREATPTYLPPETDDVFLELQGAHARPPAAAPPAAPRRESVLLYRLDELPAALTRELSPDATPRRCLFFAARQASRSVDALLTDIPEPEHDEADAAMRIAVRVPQLLAESGDYARWLWPDAVRPDGSVSRRGGEQTGFHGGDADAILRWLDERDVERVPVQRFLDQLILLRLVDEDGAPLHQVDALAGPPPAKILDSPGDGLFALPRDSDHARFALAPALDEPPDPDDERWLELHASDLPPGAVHEVTLRTPPSTRKPRAKKGPSKKTSPKPTAAKKAATTAAPARKAAAKKTPARTANANAKKTTRTANANAKKTAKKPAARKTAARAANAKKTAKKPAARKTAARAANAKKTAKKPAARKTAARAANAKKTAKKPAARKTAVRAANAKKTARTANAKQTPAG